MKNCSPSIAIVCSRYPKPNPPHFSGTVTPNNPISPILGNTSCRSVLPNPMRFAKSANLGHLVCSIDLCCARCKFFLRETFDNLAELAGHERISRARSLWNMLSYLLLIRCQSGDSCIVAGVCSTARMDHATTLPESARDEPSPAVSTLAIRHRETAPRCRTCENITLRWWASWRQLYLLWILWMRRRSVNGNVAGSLPEHPAMSEIRPKGEQKMVAVANSWPFRGDLFDPEGIKGNKG